MKLRKVSTPPIELYFRPLNRKSLDQQKKSQYRYLDLYGNVCCCVDVASCTND